MAISNRILFIINPYAGKGKTKRLVRQLELLKDKVAFRLTEYPKHSIEIVQKELNRFDVFVAVGGDGTVNELASSLVGTDKKLAVYPAGSGNGFAREFGFSKNLKQLIEAIDAGKTLPTDVVQVNGKTSVHIAGTGYDAMVAHDFTKLKGRGFLNYAISILRILAKYRPIWASIQTENQTITGRFFMINVANTAQFGYGVRIAPMANPTDGKLDLVLVESLSLWEFASFAIKLLFGILKPTKKLRYISTEKPITISTEETQLHIDGDPVLLGSPLKIEIQAGALNVVDTGKAMFS